MLKSSISLTTLPIDEKTKPTMSRDTEILETPRKIYIATDDALPLHMMLEDINFFGQGYPNWTKNDPYLSEVKNENGWKYQEPYKILLPPYEPVILVEKNIRRLEQLPLPFFADAFNHLFNEALISLSEITSTGTYIKI